MNFQRVWVECRFSWMVVVLSVVTVPLHAEEKRNPFMSQRAIVQQGPVAPVQQEEKQERYLPPRVRDALQSYQLIGVMEGKLGTVALVRTRLGEQLVIHQGEQLGREQAKVHAIDAHSVTVHQGEQVMRLTVGTVATPVVE